MSNKRVTIIECVVVDILESNLRCLVNYKCIHERTLNNLRTIFKNNILVLSMIPPTRPVLIIEAYITGCNQVSPKQ